MKDYFLRVFALYLKITAVSSFKIIRFLFFFENIIFSYFSQRMTYDYLKQISHKNISSSILIPNRKPSDWIELFKRTTIPRLLHDFSTYLVLPYYMYSKFITTKHLFIAHI